MWLYVGLIFVMFENDVGWWIELFVFVFVVVGVRLVVIVVVELFDELFGMCLMF